MHNDPMDPTLIPFDNIHYTCRYADIFEVVILRRGLSQIYSSSTSGTTVPDGKIRMTLMFEGET